MISPRMCRRVRQLPCAAIDTVAERTEPRIKARCMAGDLITEKVTVTGNVVISRFLGMSYTR